MTAPTVSSRPGRSATAPSGPDGSGPDDAGPDGSGPDGSGPGVTDTDTDDASGSGGGAPGRRVAVVALALFALVGAFLLGGRLLAPGTPSDTSVEAGFARDMQTHHNQAVEMALIVREKSTDPVLRSVAYDIATSQSQQSGQMFAWLTTWGLSQTASEPAMTWMSGVAGGHEGMGSGAASGAGSSMLLPDGRMPGMASAADLTRLRAATGRDAEVLFLQLMVAHHRGGVAMAQAAEQRTTRPEVLTLARSIVAAQTSEISAMNELLVARGAKQA